MEVFHFFILVFGYCRASLLMCINNSRFLPGWILKLLWKHLEATSEVTVCTHVSVHDVTWFRASIDVVAFCVIRSWTVWSSTFYWAAPSSWLLPPLLRPSLVISVLPTFRLTVPKLRMTSLIPISLCNLKWLHRCPKHSNLNKVELFSAQTASHFEKERGWAEWWGGLAPSWAAPCTHWWRLGRGWWLLSWHPCWINPSQPLQGILLIRMRVFFLIYILNILFASLCCWDIVDFFNVVQIKQHFVFSNLFLTSKCTWLNHLPKPYCFCRCQPWGSI